MICRYANRASPRASVTVERDRPMTTHQIRVAPQILTADRSTLLALQGLNGYQPINALYSVATLQQHEVNLTQAHQAVLRAQEALDQARAIEIGLAHIFHDAVLGAKNQVIAIFGPDALAVELIGLTRKSDHKRPVRQKPTA